MERSNNPRNHKNRISADLQKKIIETTLDILSNAVSATVDFGKVEGECDSVDMNLFTISTSANNDVRFVIFTTGDTTVEDGWSYYSAIEIDGEWVEFTVLPSCREKGTIRFNYPTHNHFYADDYSYDKILENSTTISRKFLYLFGGSHIGEGVVYDAIVMAKQQGLL